MNNNPEKKRTEIKSELMLPTISAYRITWHDPTRQVNITNKHKELNTYDFLDSRKISPGTIDDANKHVELDLPH